MENQKPKDPFAKVSTFAVIKKMQTGKSGREMVVTGFSLVGSQFDEIDDLASNQTEVMVTIQPSRRGTIYIGQDVSYRITKETHANAFDAIGELVIEASNDLRVKLLEWHNDTEDVLEWDDVESKEQIQEMLTAAIDEDNLVDAMACLILLRNLNKQTYEEACEAQQEEEQQEDEDTLFDGEGEESEQVQEEVEV